MIAPLVTSNTFTNSDSILECRFYHDTSLGSVAAITDSAGNLIESYKYDIYGQETIYNASNVQIAQSLVSNPYRFTGQRRDFEENSPLYYYWARYYKPETGRFIQRDPGGIHYDVLNLGNGYAYTHNNGVNLIDPFGLLTIFIVGFEGNDRVLEGLIKQFKKDHPNELVIWQRYDKKEEIKAGILLYNLLFKQPCENINIIGYSWGGDTGAAIAEEIKIDTLVTLDPVSHRLSPPSLKKDTTWINIHQNKTLADVPCQLVPIPILGDLLGGILSGITIPLGTDKSDTIATFGSQWGHEGSATVNQATSQPHNNPQGMYNEKGNKDLIEKELFKHKKDCKCPPEKK